MSFVNIDINFSLDSPDDFWIMNPQLRYYPPYSELYDRDKSENHSYSSRAMWVINFMQNPDEKENLFFRQSEQQRKEMLSATLAKDLNWQDDLFKKCYSSFPIDCMTSLKRNLSDLMKSLQKNIELIGNTALTLDKTEVKTDPKNGKDYALQIKGTAKQVTDIQKNIKALMQAIDGLMKKYVAEKSTLKAEGGAKISKGEQKVFW